MLSFPFNILRLSTFDSWCRKLKGYNATLFVVGIAMAASSGFSVSVGQEDRAKAIKQESSVFVEPGVAKEGAKSFRLTEPKKMETAQLVDMFAYEANVGEFDASKANRIHLEIVLIQASRNLRISRVTTSCGCVVPSEARVEAGSLHVELQIAKSGQSGRFERQVDIECMDGDSRFVARVQIAGVYKLPIEINTRSLHFRPYVKPDKDGGYLEFEVENNFLNFGKPRVVAEYSSREVDVVSMPVIASGSKSCSGRWNVQIPVTKEGLRAFLLKKQFHTINVKIEQPSSQENLKLEQDFFISQVHPLSIRPEIIRLSSGTTRLYLDIIPSREIQARHKGQLSRLISIYPSGDNRPLPFTIEREGDYLLKISIVPDEWKRAGATSRWVKFCVGNDDVFREVEVEIDD